MKKLVIEREAVKNNITVVKDRAGSACIYAVLTGDGFGAGITELAQLLREEGVLALREAKAAHDALEAVYNPYVDFDGVRAQAALEAGRLLSWLG